MPEETELLSLCGQDFPKSALCLHHTLLQQTDRTFNWNLSITDRHKQRKHSDEALQINLGAYTARTRLNRISPTPSRGGWLCVSGNQTLSGVCCESVQTKSWCMSELCFLLTLTDAYILNNFCCKSLNWNLGVTNIKVFFHQALVTLHASTVCAPKEFR